jgi:hypothetical protein
MTKKNKLRGDERLLVIISRALLLCAALLLAGAPFAAFAADDGVYLAATNTYYLNPDTGVTDDGGSKNAAIGEGMCRSVIYEKALVEIDGGKVYVTVRVQLVSNMGAIKFTVQQKAGDPASYASVSPRIVAEDAGADTADYRFALPAVSSYIGCSTYVTPMGRDVKFYMNISNSLTAGSEDFVVSVKPAAVPASESAAAAQEPAQAEQDTPPDAQAPLNSRTPTEESPGADTGTGGTGGVDAPDNVSPAVETGASENAPPDETRSDETAAGLTDDSEAADIVASAGVPAGNSVGSNDSLPGDTAAPEIFEAQGDEDAAAGGISGILIGLIALIAVVLVVCAVMVLRKRKV